MNSTEAFIEIRGLKRYFGKLKAVDGISFSFQSGDVFGFIGPNGAGKTTTLRILATLDDATEGDVLVNGVSARNYPDRLRRLVGFVPDSLPTHGDITVHEYIDFFARAYSVPGSQRNSVVESVEEFTKVTGFRDRLLKALSKGMKQRVSLARALVHDPAVLIMDEPAEGLDPRARVEFRELVSALAGMGKAILISSHILTELTEVCTGAVIIERGRLVTSGTLAEISLSSGREQERRAFLMRSMDDPEILRKALLQMPLMEQVRVVGRDVHIEIKGGEDTASDLLAELIRNKHRIVEFRRVEDDLEDIFMRVTKGDLA
jgi:ABC-2 type transport system ATP-binding protein